MWFATHWLMSVKFRDGEHESYPVIERVVLVEARDHEEAPRRAALLARREREEDPPLKFTHAGRPADCVFIGVRKIICLSTQHGGSEVSLEEGEELTCWFYDVGEEEDLKKLAEGDRVKVEYID